MALYFGAHARRKVVTDQLVDGVRHTSMSMMMEMCADRSKSLPITF